MSKLTDRQQLILEFIRSEVERKGYPPSVREIGEAVGLQSSSTVHGHLQRLEELGYISDRPNRLEVLNSESGASRVRAVQCRWSVELPLVCPSWPWKTSKNTTQSQ